MAPTRLDRVLEVAEVPAFDSHGLARIEQVFEVELARVHEPVPALEVEPDPQRGNAQPILEEPAAA